MDICKLVGDNLRKLRTRSGLSQDELAYRAGLDRTYVSGIERGLRNPSVLVLWQLSGPLGVEPAAFLALPEEAAPASD